MPAPHPLALQFEQRLLIHAPTGRDSALACEALGRVGLRAEQIADVRSLCEAMEAGAGAVLLAEEALSPQSLAMMSEVLGRQPPWSDLPIVIFAASVGSQTGTRRMEEMLRTLGNVTFVERPIRVATLATVMSSALRARKRQYAARQMLETLGLQEEDARTRADFEQQLIGIVSHDLRNPLHAILLSAGVLARREDLDDAAARSVLRIQTSAERAIRMIRDLLDFTQARLGGGIRIKRAPASLHALTRAVLDEVEAAWPHREVQVRHVGDGFGDWDADRIVQVLQNLVTNALKYSPDGTPVRVETMGGDTEVVFCVHNQGDPIAPEQVGRLFEPMQRATSEIDSAGRSVGLGLYIVKYILDAHGGTIDVRFSEEDGTTFTVRLPRASPVQNVVSNR